MLANLPSNKLKLLAFASDRVSYSQGDMLFHQGDSADAAYIVIDGEADVLVGEGDAAPSKVASLGPNSVVGDMAILCDIPRTASIQASKPLEALRIKREHMVELINESPALAMSILRELVERLANTTRDLSEAKAKLSKLER